MNAIPTEKAWVLGLFREVMGEEAANQLAFVYAHPVLLSRQALDIVLEESPDDRTMVDLLVRAQQRLWDYPEEYPRGTAPLDQLIEGVRNRELTLDQARERAIQWRCAGLLSNTYIKVVIEQILAEVWDGGAFPAQAAELVLDSARAMPFKNLAVHVRLGAIRGFVLVVHATLTQNPDGRLLGRAHEAAAWALDRVDGKAYPMIRGNLLHELGVMDLDAYTSKWPATPEYLDRIAPWLARAVNPMPAPAEALARAGRLLGEAVELREPGSDRGATLKSLIQARIFEAAAEDTDPDRDELRVLAQQALENLDANRDAEAVQWVHQAIAVFDLD